MMERFFLKDHPIFIYGYKGRGRQIGDELVNAGYDLKGYIDANPDPDAACDLPVYTPDEIQKAEILPQTIVIISLKSGMLHDPIAAGLFKMGFCNILYCPIELRHSYEYRQMMRDAYQRVTDFEFDNVGAVPAYSCDEKLAARRVIRMGNGYVSFWCPTDDIRHCSFGMRLERNSISGAHFDILKKYEGCTLPGYRPYTQMMAYLVGEDADISEYLELCGKTEHKEEWMRSRAKLYEVFNDALKHDLSFFTDSPSPCIWDEDDTTGEGGLVISEGATRAHYLIHKGYTRVPVSVTMADYERYCGK